MATVKIETFGGIAPRQHPTQLADGMATIAQNVKLESGKLVPLRQPLIVSGAKNIMENGLADPADAKSIHVWRNSGGEFDFLLFPGWTWSAPGNVAADDLTRIVVSGDRTGDGEVDEPVVYMRDPVAGKVVYPIRKEPIGFPVVSRDAGAIDPDEANIRYTRFFYTWVDKYGMESPVSMPSRVLVGTYLASDGWSYNPETGKITKDSQTIDVSSDEWTINMSVNTFVSAQRIVDDDLQYVDGDAISFEPIGAANWPALATAIRVYKVIAGTQEGRVQFIAERSKSAIDSGASGFTLTVKDEDAGEIIPEIEAPPADLTCIRDVPGSFYCGFAPSAPKTVCFSDIDLLYSWPTQYRYDVADNLVALAVTSNSVFALTDGWPYVISGTAPESMTVSKLASPAACVSPRGVCVLDNTVFYASNEGLMAISNSANAGTVVTNVTDQIYTKDQWQALNPASCLAGHYRGRLFLYFTARDGEEYPGGARHMGLTVNMKDGMKVAVTTHDEAAACLCVDVREDEMYFIGEGVE